MEENYNQITAGQKFFTIKLTADYRVGRSLNFRFFFDRIVNTPKISNTFPTRNTNFGFSIRFTLSG